MQQSPGQRDLPPLLYKYQPRPIIRPKDLSPPSRKPFAPQLRRREPAAERRSERGQTESRAVKMGP